MQKLNIREQSHEIKGEMTGNVSALIRSQSLSVFSKRWDGKRPRSNVQLQKGQDKQDTRGCGYAHEA